MDRFHRHNSTRSLLLFYLVLHTLAQLSYKPLGEPDPAAVNLGVAVLLVRFRTYLVSLHLSPSDARHHHLSNVLCLGGLEC